MRALVLTLAAVFAANACGGAAAAEAPGIADRADRRAYSMPAPELEPASLRAFFAGRALFRRQWRPAPAGGNDEGLGLGPLYNRRSCAGCHVRDGRAAPPAPGAAGPARGMTAILAPHPRFGRQLQDQAVPGARPEGRLAIAYEERAGVFADGARFSLRAPRYRILGPDRELAAPLSPRVAPGVFGLGLIEAVAEDEIVNPGPGARGRVSRVGGAAGRFGWRAERARLRDQVAAAAREDIGLTAPDEITEAEIQALVAYLRGLAVPARRGAAAPAVRRGEAVFAAAGCAACHRPRLRTGPAPPVAAFANRVIRPYTDLRLHDMGPALADGVGAGRMWRTPPLWGLGLLETVNGHTALLHDGRARGAMEAILWHGGEAAAARGAVLALGAPARADLLAFLASL